MKETPIKKVALFEEEQRANDFAAYDKVCSALLHYGAAIRNIRITSVTQGVIIIAGAVLALSRVENGGGEIGVFGACFYGIFTTLVLWKMQTVYWGYFSAHLEEAVSLEKRLQFQTKTWTRHSAERDKNFKSKRRPFLRRNKGKDRKNLNSIFVNGGLFYAILATLIAIVIFGMNFGDNASVSVDDTVVEVAIR